MSSRPPETTAREQPENLAVLLEMADQFPHRLLGHPRPLGEHRHGRAGVVEVLEHRPVRGAYVRVAVLGQVRHDQVIERDERFAQQDHHVQGAGGAGEHGQTR